jgi:hypothetical protein
MVLRRSIGVLATLLVLVSGFFGLSLGTQPASEADYSSAVWVGGREGVTGLSASDGEETIEIADAGSIRSLMQRK